MKEFINKAPELIREASKSTLGVISLLIIALSLLALTFFTTASEIIRVAIFVLVFIGAGLFTVVLLRHTKSENSEMPLTTHQASDLEPAGSDMRSSQNLSITATCMQDGTAHFVLTAEGSFVGGVESLRRISIDLLDTSWDGNVEVHHAYLEKLERQVDDMRKQLSFTAEEAKTFERLKSHVSAVKLNIEILRLAIKLTFVPAPDRRPTWEVPMDSEKAFGFLTGIFTENHLIPGSVNWTVPCQLYVPERLDDPLCIDIRLSENEVNDIQKSWEQELRTNYKEHEWIWSTWGWLTHIPVWKLQDDFIAARLLPSIVHGLISRVVGTNQPATIGDTWQELNKRFPASSKRDIFVPYYWCLALNSNQTSKDLAWLNSPPQSRSQIYEMFEH